MFATESVAALVDICFFSEIMMCFWFLDGVAF